MTPGDGGCLPGTVILSSPAVVGRHAVIYKLGRDGRICAVPSVLAKLGRPYRPRPSDGTVDHTEWWEEDEVIQRRRMMHVYMWHNPQ